MCLAAFALNAHPRFPLVVAANRDEFFARPAAPMDWWQAGSTELLAGRDLSAGGTWFGLTRSGRLALLTNVREPQRQRPDAPSRGRLVPDWLGSDVDAPGYHAQTLAPGYNGFNLVTGDLRRNAWHWLSNRAMAPVALGAGLHAVSNAALDTPWPKTEGLKAALADALARCDSAEALAAQLLTALADDRPAPDALLPDTGVGLARERLLSPRFVRMPGPDGSGRSLYGTRCATVLVRAVDGTTLVVERSFTDHGVTAGDQSHHFPRWPAG